MGAADYVFAPDPLGGVDLAKATASRFFDDGKRFSRDAETRKRTALFFLGGRGSSTTYHEHSHAYNALFYGAKLWALLPPLAGDFRGGGAPRGIPRSLQKYRSAVKSNSFPAILGPFVFSPQGLDDWRERVKIRFGALKLKVS